MKATFTWSKIVSVRDSRELGPNFPRIGCNPPTNEMWRTSSKARLFNIFKLRRAWRCWSVTPWTLVSSRFARLGQNWTTSVNNPTLMKANELASSEMAESGSLWCRSVKDKRRVGSSQSSSATIWRLSLHLKFFKLGRWSMARRVPVAVALVPRMFRSTSDLQWPAMSPFCPENSLIQTFF